MNNNNNHDNCRNLEMTTYTKTQWFPAEHFPVYEGVYERDMREVVFTDEDAYLIYSYWDGEVWLISAGTVQQAEFERYEDPLLISCYQDLPWRGVTKENN